MSAIQVSDADFLDAAFKALLLQHPSAPVAAIDDHGLYVPMPDSIEIGSHAQIVGRSALDLVIPADRVVVIDAWERGREAGASRASVRLRGSPDRTVVLQLFDLRARHGIFGIVIVGAERAAELAGLSDAPPIAPRLGIQRKNDVAVITGVDEAFTQMLGWEASDIVGEGSLGMIHPEDQDRAIETWMEMLAIPGSTRRVRLRHRRADGSWLWVEITNRNLLDDPEELCVLAEVIDVSDEVAAHEAVRVREQLLHRIAETIPLGLIQIDSDGKVVYTNERLHEMIGCEPADRIRELLAGVAPDNWPKLESAISTAVVDAADADVEVLVYDSRRGSERQCRFSLRALTSEAAVATGAIMCVEDVTESARMRVELERRATFDELTGCLNRASVMGALDDALAGGSRVGVVFVDLDGFKQVNDELGHSVGDELLVAVAGRLRGAVRDGDVVGRLGGDEFLVVCPGADRPGEVQAIARRISEANREALLIGSDVVVARASIGVAVSNGRLRDADSVVADADAAMYESKRRGASEVVMFEPGLREGGEGPAAGRSHSMHARRR